MVALEQVARKCLKLIRFCKIVLLVCELGVMKLSFCSTQPVQLDFIIWLILDKWIWYQLDCKKKRKLKQLHAIYAYSNNKKINASFKAILFKNKGIRTAFSAKIIQWEMKMYIFIMIYHYDSTRPTIHQPPCLPKRYKWKD